MTRYSYICVFIVLSAISLMLINFTLKMILQVLIVHVPLRF